MDGTLRRRTSRATRRTLRHLGSLRARPQNVRHKRIPGLPPEARGWDVWRSRGTCRTRAGSRSPFVGGHGSVRRAQPPRRGRGQASQRFPQPPFLLRVNDRNIVVAPPRSGKGNDGQPSGWEIVRTVDIPVELHSGTNTVTISGNTPWAPDIDRVIVR